MKCAVTAGRFFQEKWGNPFYEGLFWEALSTYRLGNKEKAMELAMELKTHSPHYRKCPPKEFVDEAEMKARRPVEMKPFVNRALIGAYEEMMKRNIIYSPLNKKINYRWLILQQARHFGDCLEDPEKPYKPFSWEG